MQSFRHELEDLENPLVEKDIIDLEKKIRQFREGKIDEEKFRSLRLARGVYGQRQPGVQMVRIKIPYGKASIAQLFKIADVADRFSNGNLHLTTRQDVQIHYVSLERTPELWAELEKEDITLREACGNTVRNITASPEAGIDPEEPFDVSPYADALFKYFLRNPICQEMGRKFKIAFSSSEKDSAYTFIHDLGFIPKVKDNKKGFKVLLGGGLGAQPFLAQIAHDFLPTDRIIPFTEAVLRIFDRHGERSRRHKARIKYLIDEIGLESFLDLVSLEERALPYPALPIDLNEKEKNTLRSTIKKDQHIQNLDAYDLWLNTNVKEQKQKGYFSVAVKIPQGNLNTETLRKLLTAFEDVIANDIRISQDQGLLFKFILPENLPYIFNELEKLGLHSAGSNSTGDITSCPGTDTCNLGITSSYGISRELEKVIRYEYPLLLDNKDLRIRISGCMNSCGQHGMATIGFHGSTIRFQGKLIPALQVLIGGGSNGDGKGRIADKIVKIPTRKGPDALRLLLDDYTKNKSAEESFENYYSRNEKEHFYHLLKPLADEDKLTETDFIDWEQDKHYQQAIGVGECAGVAIDLITTLIEDTREKLELSREYHRKGEYSHAIYFSYSTFVNGAKTLLIERGEKTNSQAGIIDQMDEILKNEQLNGYSNQAFRDTVYFINQYPPERDFSLFYLEKAEEFFYAVEQIRKQSNHVKLSHN